MCSTIPGGMTSLAPHALRVDATLNPAWPPGAWLACCHTHSDTIQLTHGRNIEVTPEWFGEVVWAGSYTAGAFDETDVVFGSGGRIRGRQVTFVSPASTVDRLHSLQRDGRAWISNSLALLSTATAARLDPAYPRYAPDLRSIVNGLSRHRDTLDTSAGTIRLTYYDNLTWDGTALRPAPKPTPWRDFGSFAAYRGFLDGALAGMAANMADGARAHPYRFLGTISSGYDSATVATLARPHGLREVVTFTTSRTGEPDSGAEVAAALGLERIEVPRDAWRNGELPEVPFLAADGKGEDVYFAGAAGRLEGRVLLTGFHGDKMWDEQTTATSPDIVRGDQSGLSLSEFRTRAGFVHVPLAFLGVRQIKDIRALSVSPAMRPWHTRPDYSRPICRRIVEEAGVPRAAFGQRKNAASVLFYDRGSALSSASLSDYAAWLRDRGLGSASSGNRQMVHRFCAAAADGLLDAGGGLRLTRVLAARLARYSWEPLSRHLFPWAVERAAHAYRRGSLPA
jgi:hypothetical protein